METCLIVVTGSCNDYYGIYCREVDISIEKLIKFLSNHYPDRILIEYLFSKGTIDTIIEDEFWIRIHYEKSDSSNTIIEYFENFNELLSSYQYVKNILIFTPYHTWIANPKCEKELTYFLTNLLN